MDSIRVPLKLINALCAPLVRILFGITFALTVIAVTGCAKDARDLYPHTLSYAEVAAKKHPPEVVALRAMIGKREDLTGVWGIYDGEDPVGRPVKIRVRDRLETGMEYELPGALLSSSNEISRQYKMPVFQADGASPVSGTPMWVGIVAGLVAVGAVAAGVLFLAPKIRMWNVRRRHKLDAIHRANEARAREEALGQAKTEYVGTTSLDPSEMEVNSTAGGLVVDLGKGRPTKAIEMPYLRGQSFLSRDINEKVTAYQISRKGDAVRHSETATDVPIHRQIEVDENSTSPALSRSGSFVILCVETGEMYVLASKGSRNPTSLVKSDGRRVLVTDQTPVRLDNGDVVKVGEIKFLYRPATIQV